MNQGLVRQINDIVRPYRKARMGLLIVISDIVGQSGPTPPLAWQYMVGRNWYKHTIHGTASVNGVHGQQPVEMTLFAWPENRIADWHSVGGRYTQQYGYPCVLCVSPTGHTKMLRYDHGKMRYGDDLGDWDPHQIEAYGSTILGESYACTGIDVDYRRIQFPEFNRQDGIHFGALSDYIGSEYILLFPKRRISLVRRGIWRHSIEDLANICNVPFDVVEQTYLDTPDDPTEYKETFYALYVRKSRLQEVFGVFKRTLMSRAITWMLCITPRGYMYYISPCTNSDTGLTTSTLPNIAYDPHADEFLALLAKDRWELRGNYGLFSLDTYKSFMETQDCYIKTILPDPEFTYCPPSVMTVIAGHNIIQNLLKTPCVWA